MVWCGGSKGIRVVGGYRVLTEIGWSEEKNIAHDE